MSKERILKKLTTLVLVMTMMLGTLIYNSTETMFAAAQPMVVYNAHLQNIGWQGWMPEGETAGTTGQNRQMEAIRIKLSKNGTSMITYRAHVKSYGWLDWVESGEIAGTTGKAYRMEGIQIKLKNDYASQYDIYYRMHVSTYGWLGWAKNGETAGTEGVGLQAEAIEIRLVRKGTYFNAGGKAGYFRPDVNYRAHCANVGWMNTVQEGEMAGSTGYSRRMEALIIRLKDFTGGNGVFYRAHVAGSGWQDWRSSGQMMGTTGQSRQMEAVEIKLSDSLAPCLDIYYRVHVSNVGWLGWAKNGETAGSTGQSLAIEAIEIKLEHKGTKVNVGASAIYQTSTSSNDNGYSQKVNEFINSQQWCNGAYYGASQSPILARGYEATGCCAYAADFVKYVFGKYGFSGGTIFDSPSQIRSGDVIKVTESQHWFVVLYRNGEQLTTAEGNWTNGRVVISNNAYTVRGNTLYRDGRRFRRFACGYHFQ